MNRCGGRHGDRDPRNGRLRMSEPRALVEHFFRHEFGRLVAVLTRSLGVRRLDLVGGRRAGRARAGPGNLVSARRARRPGRLALPHRPQPRDRRLRREQTHAQALPRLADEAERESSPPEAHFADEIGDEPLRLLFVCCHEAVPAESRVAFALGRSAVSAPRRSPAACSPPRPTSRSASSGPGIGCASWTSISTRRPPPSFALGWTRSSRSSISCSVRAATPPMPMCRSAATCATRPGGWRGCSPPIPSATSRRSMPCSP